jgi:hypothetical protein
VSSRPTPTIRDVAKAAGVSIATVSRVLNDAARVTEDTGDRVLSLVDKMGYAPHGGTRAVVVRRTRTLGVLLPELYGEFFSEFIRGIDETAKKHGFLTLVTSARREANEIAAAVSNMRGRVDGFLAVSPSVAARATLAEVAERYPTVYARQPGAVAAPTAGLHFDAAMLAGLREAGIEQTFVTLHVGAGTFQPVRAERLSEHRMHSEWFEVGAATVAAIATTEKTRAVKLALGRDKVTLSVTIPENGTASEEVPADYAAADIEVGFNYRYLLDILGQVGSDLVDVHLADASAPTLIRENDEAKALYVLMPMRV